MSTLRLRRYAPACWLSALNPARRDLLFAPFLSELHCQGISLVEECASGFSVDEEGSLLGSSGERQLPEALREALVHIDLLADEAGQDILLAVLRSKNRKPPVREAVTPADLAAELWLSRPNWVRQAVHRQMASQETLTQRFSFFPAISGPLVPRNETLAALGDCLLRSAEARGGDLSLQTTTHFWSERTWILFRWGETFERRKGPKIGATRGVLAQPHRVAGNECFRPERHDLVLLDGIRGEVELWVRHRKAREEIRQLLEREIVHCPLSPSSPPSRVAV